MTFDPYGHEAYAIGHKLFTPHELEVISRAFKVGLSVDQIRKTLGLEPRDDDVAQAVASGFGDIRISDLQPGGRLHPTGGVLGHYCSEDVRIFAPPHAPVAAMTSQDDTRYGEATRDENGQPIKRTATQPTPADRHQAGGDPSAIKARMDELGLDQTRTFGTKPNEPEKPPTYWDVDADKSLVGKLSITLNGGELRYVVAYDTIKGWYEVRGEQGHRHRYNGAVRVEWRNDTPKKAIDQTQLDADVENLTPHVNVEYLGCKFARCIVVEGCRNNTASGNYIKCEDHMYVQGPHDWMKRLKAAALEYKRRQGGVVLRP